MTTKLTYYLLKLCFLVILDSINCFTLQAVGYTLMGLKFDLSPYSLDLGKMLATCLHVQDDETRDHAVFASKILSSKVNVNMYMASVV